ncbi:MAG: membrane lipoprotein lipid attachment site-containing protein [Bacteroidales bacterium]|nr:membrane lipoprotein lipid attachment site-containing protein [Bacteroidales bacterium]
MKKYLLFLASLFILAACNTATDAEAKDEAVEQTELTVGDFSEKASGLVDQKIRITGLVVHTCKHGGKRMFLSNETSEGRVEVSASEEVGSFNAEMEGSMVTVEGVVKEQRIDNAYLDQWEKEIAEGNADEMKIHEGEEKSAEGEEEEDHHKGDLETVQNYRNQLAETGKEYLSFFSVECHSYSVVPEK